MGCPETTFHGSLPKTNTTLHFIINVVHSCSGSKLKANCYIQCIQIHRNVNKSGKLCIEPTTTLSISLIEITNFKKCPFELFLPSHILKGERNCMVIIIFYCLLLKSLTKTDFKNINSFPVGPGCSHLRYHACFKLVGI